MRTKSVVAAVVTTAIAAGAAGAAVGQDTAGPPTGSFTFEVAIPMGVKHREGINPAVPRDRTRPKIADMLAGNADLLTDGKVTGRTHHVEVTTFTPRAKRYRGKGVWHWFDMHDFGGGNLLFTECFAEDSPTDNPCAVTGGTGRYAGARGSAVVQFAKARENRKERTVTVPIAVTFVP
jgi:hypothetical protein